MADLGDTIDAQVPTDDLFAFSLAYPLPFRILFLSSLTLVLFASNLHLLSSLGIDTAQVLDIRLHSPHLLPTPSTSRATAGPSSSSSSSATSAAPPPYVHPRKLYPPLYHLAALALVWTALGWLAFRNLTGGDLAAMNSWRGVPAFTALVVGAAMVWPGNVLCKPQRQQFVGSLKRIVSPALYRPVPFCDIILADILTSSAKVLGDVWVAGCLVWKGVEASRGADACGRVWGVPFMTSLPYLFRFRQCLSEVLTGSTPTPRRSLLNALKYATAFPVIVLSAMQTVIGDPFDDDDEAVPVHEAGERWIGRTALFRLWVLAVLVNSLYSFWWDVTNDWGLSLLTRSGWSSSPSVSFAFIHPPANPSSHGYAPLSSSAGSTRHPPPPSRTTSSTHSPVHGRARSTAGGMLAPPGSGLAAGGEDHSVTFPPPSSRPGSPASGTATPGASTPSKGPRPLHHGHARAFSTAAAPNLSYPFLRPILLLPDPMIYYLCVALDLLLRFTWSLKLSPHLHNAQEVEAGVFVVELMEVVRRWMWVYLRIEWEAVRKGAGSDPLALSLGASSALSASAGASGGAGGGAGVSWLEKDDGEARLRAHEEYELAARNGGPASGGGGGRYRNLIDEEGDAELGIGVKARDEL
ncbi:hypothetical protein JCM10207_005214 [Rhodosporidiobolus poonsookiae]